MPQPDDGGPAFPTDNECQTGPNTFHFTGMTMRQRYASKATIRWQDVEAMCMEIFNEVPFDCSFARVYAAESKLRYIFADAMIAAEKLHTQGTTPPCPPPPTP